MSGDHASLVERLRIAFAASLMNANAGMKWLDHDSMDEMIQAGWVGFEQVADDLIERLSLPSITVEGDALDQRTIRLVLAARNVAFGGYFDGGCEHQAALIKELDEASEAFASNVAWDDPE